MINNKKGITLTILSIIFFSFFTEVLMLIMYYPAPISPFNTPKLLYTIAYYISLFLFGFLLAKTSRYGKAFVWIFGLFILFGLIFAYLFSNLSYIFMGNNLGAQLGEFKSLMPKILPLSIFINIPMLIFGYSISFILHSIYGRYSLSNSKSVGDNKVFTISLLVLAISLLIFVPTVYNINDIGSYWHKIIYNISVQENGTQSEINIRIVNNLNDKIEIVNLYVPIYIQNEGTKTFGMDIVKNRRYIMRGKSVSFTIKVNEKKSKLHIGRSYVKLLYKGKILRKDYQ